MAPLSPPPPTLSFSLLSTAFFLSTALALTHDMQCVSAAAATTPEPHWRQPQRTNVALAQETLPLKEAAGVAAVAADEEVSVCEPIIGKPACDPLYRSGAVTTSTSNQRELRSILINPKSRFAAVDGKRNRASHVTSTRVPERHAAAAEYERDHGSNNVVISDHHDTGVESTGQRLLRRLADAVIRIHDTQPEYLDIGHWGPLRKLLYETLPPENANPWGGPVLLVWLLFKFGPCRLEFVNKLRCTFNTAGFRWVGTEVLPAIKNAAEAAYEAWLKVYGKGNLMRDLVPGQHVYVKNRQGPEATIRMVRQDGALAELCKISLDSIVFSTHAQYTVEDFFSREQKAAFGTWDLPPS